jgi:hypothetical protein
MSDDFHFSLGICISMCHGANKNTELRAMASDEQR